MLSGTVEVISSIIHVLILIVPEKALLPHLPAASISQLGDGTVEESDGGSGVIVVGYPCHCIVDTIVVNIKETVTQGIFGWILEDLPLKDFLDACPDIQHVELVCNPLHRRPVRAQAIIIHTDAAQDLIDGIHGGGIEVLSKLVVRSVTDDFLVRATVHVDCRDAIFACGLTVEHLQSLDSHGVNGMSNGFIIVVGEATLTKECSAHLGLSRHGIGHSKENG